jgi:predicted nucleic acid-binding protein
LKVYLDVCSLNRPFDDQSDDRVKLESEYILLILNKIQKGEYLLFGSDIIFYEIEKMMESEKKEKVLKLTNLFTRLIKFNEKIEKRAKNLEKFGFDPLDALHISSAEYETIDVFLTTDDDLLSKAKKNENNLKVKIDNPINWFMELI